MPDNESLPATRDENPLEIRADALPERRFAADSIRAPLPPAVYERIGQLALTPEQEKILDEPLDEEEIDIRPDGLLYVSHEYCRRKLNEAFGRLQWTLVPGSPLAQEPGTNHYYRVWILFVGGVYVSEAMAARDYFPDNRQQDLSDVAESIKSDCIRRVCKDLGLAHEIWNRGFAEKARKKLCVQVVAPVTRRGQTTNERLWRRKDRDPFPGELGTVAEIEKRTSARSAGSAVKTETPPSPTTAPAAAPSDSSGKAPAQRPESGERQAGDVPPIQPSRVETPGPTDPRPMRGGLLPQQERAIWARARNAGLVVKDDAEALVELLQGYSTIVPVAGRRSTENAAAMIKGVAGIRLAALLKQIDASKGRDPETVETI